MNRELTYCSTQCPIKENCKRSTSHLTEEEFKQHLYLFTESPGAYRTVSGKGIWVCDKQLKIK